MDLEHKSQSTRVEILDAALELVCGAGSVGLTIDAVAEKSGFSKGGVLYNFPTKDALIRAMVQLLADRFSHDIDVARTSHADTELPTVMAMIDVTQRWVRSDNKVARSVLVTSLCVDGHIEPFVRLNRRLKEQIKTETTDVPRALAVWAALEGIHFTRAHGVSVHSDEDCDAIFNELRNRLAGRTHN